MGFEIIMAAVKHNNSEGVSQKTKNYGLFCNVFSSSSSFGLGKAQMNITNPLQKKE